MNNSKRTPAHNFMRRARRWSLLLMAIHALIMVICKYSLSSGLEPLVEVDTSLLPIISRWWDLALCPVVVHIFLAYKAYNVERESLLQHAHFHEFKHIKPSVEAKFGFEELSKRHFPISNFSIWTMTFASAIFIVILSMCTLALGILPGAVAAAIAGMGLILFAFALRIITYWAIDIRAQVRHLKSKAKLAPTSFKTWLTGN